MADPTIQTFCCHQKNVTTKFSSLMTEFNSDSYILTCLFSSSLGIIGALYQIFLRNDREFVELHGRRIYNSGRKIIIWLAVSDLCASIGIFIRSAIWRYIANIIPSEDDTSSVLFCAISSAWAQFFYTCTWIWTFCYAINVRRTLHKRPTRENIFHFVTWTTSAVLTAVGLSVLYFPDANCHEVSYLITALYRILPNYCVTYIPIAIVMIANPILYSKSSKEIDRQLSLSLNQVTTRERDIMRTFVIKFSAINIVFYICWLPNIINGLVIWIFWRDFPIKLTIVIWYFMAILNPLQAFLNALVYRKWDKNIYTYQRNRTLVNQIKNRSRPNIFNEKSPLLQKTTERNYPSSIASMSTLQVPKINTKFSVNSCCSL